MDARKHRFDAAAVSELAEKSTEVVVARGQNMLGPSGNLKAPTIQFGKTLLVGWKEEIWAKSLR